MKLKLTGAVCLLLMGIGAQSTASATDSAGCTLATLRGTLSWSGTSWKAGTPRAASGFESYDGAGHMKYTELYSDGYTTTPYTGTGTYTITAGCLASVTYDGAGPAFLFFVAPDGSSYVWTNNQNTGVVASGRAERVSHELLVK